MIFDAAMQSELDDRARNDVFRRIVPKEQAMPFIMVDGRKLVNLSSNDYLGLGQDADLRDEFIASLQHEPCFFSSSGSSLLTGAHPQYLKAQRAVEELFPGKSCLFFNSGFAANSGCIAALGAIKGTLVLADRLAHASIIDGMTSGGKIRAMRFPHNDMQALEQRISSVEDEYAQILVVTEAVFSMDGDMAPLKELAAIKKRHPKVALYVDEAHSFAVFGDEGRGLCHERGVIEDVDFILCTLGKGLGSEGAFVLTSKTARDYLVNCVRPLIFSTAIAPVAYAHTAFMLRKMREAGSRRERLARIASHIREAVTESGVPNLSSSQIIPYLTHTNEKAVAASAAFRERGLYAMPIRHPTVPLNQARLRISLSAALSDEQVETLREAILALRSGQ